MSKLIKELTPEEFIKMQEGLIIGTILLVLISGCFIFGITTLIEPN
jgi:hypothetical protein